jgi:hypothetical protein
MASLRYMSRQELEDEAASRGIDTADMENKQEIIDAIEEYDGETEGDDDAPDETPEPTPAAAGGDTVAESTPEDHGEEEVQEMFDEEQEKGYVGQTTDHNPDTVYSLEGGAPQAGDNPEAPSLEDAKADPKLGDQSPGLPKSADDE